MIISNFEDVFMLKLDYLPSGVLYVFLKPLFKKKKFFAANLPCSAINDYMFCKIIFKTLYVNLKIMRQVDHFKCEISHISLTNWSVYVAPP